MNNEGAKQMQTQRGGQQSQSQGNRAVKPEPQEPDPQDTDTLTEEDYSAGDPHPDSRPDSRRDQTVDPERSGGAQDRSQSI
jgi:hypothetical protein